jgi:hypothetical protein
VQQYLNALNSAVADRPEVQRYVVRCVDCGIRFLTDYRNPDRNDLRCPFGCRRCHENQRIAKYRQTPRGKRTKHQLNTQYYENHRRRSPSDDGRHRDLSLPTPPRDASPADEPSATIEFSSGGVVPSQSADSSVSPSAPPERPLNDAADASAEHQPPATIEISPGGVVLNESDVARSPVVPYVQRLFRLIDGVKLTCSEVIGLLQDRLRQRSMVRRSRIAYALAFLHQYPP